MVKVTLGFDSSLLFLFKIFLGVDDAILSNDETKKVESVLNSITDNVATSLGQSTMLSQGTCTIHDYCSSTQLRYMLNFILFIADFSLILKPQKKVWHLCFV